MGTVSPQTEIGADPSGVLDYAQAVEDMGFTQIAIFDYVVGAGPENRDFPMVYTTESMFHEPFVVYGYLAAVTRKIELVTSVIVLPQRQMVLAAKQAAEIDVLTHGRFRLGVSVGGNPVEYQALNENFHNRGARTEEQVEVRRKLWTEPIVDFHGKWHTIDRAGLNLLPIQKAIPVWFGGISERAIRWIAWTADGWMPDGNPLQGWPALVARVRGYVRDAGRWDESTNVSPSTSAWPVVRSRIQVSSDIAGPGDESEAVPPGARRIPTCSVRA